MAEVQLHRVEAGLAREPRGYDEAGGDRLDLVGGHGVGQHPTAQHPHQVQGARGPERPPPALVGVVGEGAAVAELERGRGPLGVDDVGEAPEFRDHLRSQVELVPKGAPVGLDRAVGHRGHADATGRERAVVLDQVLAHAAVRGHALEGGGADHPVPEGDPAEPEGREGIGHARAPRGGSQGARRRTRSISH